MRNRRPDLNGIVVIDKPIGWSSARVCAHIRRITGGAKVGHAGTLDPLATGVLVCCLGRATKSIPGLMDTDKDYRADVSLQAFSTTDDLEGEQTRIDVADPPTRADIEAALAPFRGEILQTPPAFSAVHVDGRRAYRLARAGVTPTLQPRRVRIDAIHIADYHWPALVLDITCGKGTYMRSVARDLGTALGTGGMLTALVRTRVGHFTLAHARTPPDTLDAEDLIDPTGSA